MAHGLADPRGIKLSEVTPPARRHGAAGPGGRLLLIDNGKLVPGYGPYAVIADCLGAALPADWSLQSYDLLQQGEEEIGPLADALLAARSPAGVVLALADAGVSVQTALLAIALEQRGVPTVLLATPLGARLVRAVYGAYAPGLPLVVLDTVRTDSPDRVRRLVEESLPEIRRGLAEPPGIATSSMPDLFPEAGRAASWSVAASAMADFQDWAEQAEIGDGLPLLPPTQEAIDRLLRRVDDDPDAVIYGPAITSGRTLRVRDAAANAAMTACPPQSFPVVLAALRAVAKPGYRLSQAAVTTHPSGNAVVFAGGDPAAFGLSGGAGCLGPGHRGNASVGRTVSLSIQHLFGARPGKADLTTFGSPAELTYCLAETVEGNPWPSLAADFGSSGPGVFVMKAESPRNVLEHLATTAVGICEGLAGAATAICSNNAHIPGDLLVLVNPEHAKIFADAGWTRQDLASAIHLMARMPRARLLGHGVGAIRPRYMDALDELPVTRSPADVHVVVAGDPSPQSMVALPWGYSRGQWQPIAGDA